MKQLISVIKNELIRYFLSPLAYVYLIAFLILNGSFAIYFGHFIERGNADLSPMFAFQPWLYLLFIPGISMRLWAEEFKSKTIVQIMTMPVATAKYVWGKFFAGWIFCAIALFLTFPFVITVNILGNPDNGLIFLGYLGSFTLAGCMLAISATMSALTKNQVIALVLAVIANIVFFFSGMEYILAILRPIAPSYIVDMVSSFSFLTHFNTIIVGLLEMRDIVFFASIILLFNFTTTIIVDFKTSGNSGFLHSTNKKSYFILFIAFIIAFAGINLISNNTLRRMQYDFTEEKIYTLNHNTVAILKNIKNPVTIKLYYSPVLGKNNSVINKMFDRVKVLLSQYKAIAGAKLEYKIYTPSPFDKIEDIALGEGIEPLPSVSENSNALFGLTIGDDIGNKIVIPFLATEREAFLEYDISEAIYLLSHKKSNLGIITSLPVLGKSENDILLEKWEIVRQLEKFYNIKQIETVDDFKNIDLLMIVHPKNLDDELKERIKKYANAGGKALILLDIAPEATRLISASNGVLTPSEFDDLAEFFGFKFYSEYVAADFENSILVNASNDYKNNTNFTNDVIQFILKSKNINPKMQETYNLKEIMFSSAGLLMPSSEKVNFIALLKTSDNSAVLPAEVVTNNMNPADILRFYQPDDNDKIIAARIFNKDITKPFDIIVVADTDMLYDTFWTKIYNMPNSRYNVPILDNANFILNSLETLSRQNYLSSLRGKSSKHRRFDKIEQIRRENKLEYSKNELKILDDINNVKQELQNIWQRKEFENREMFTKDDLDVIKNVRSKLDAEREKLGLIRKNSNAKLDEIYTLIKFFNIYSVALIIAVLALLQYVIRRSELQKSGANKGIFDRKLISIFCSSIALLCIGMMFAYFAGRSNIDRYENKPVFAKLTSQINDIKYIEMANNKESVTLSFDGEKWKNEEHPDFVVMQEQVRSFLSSLLEASFYEKKSALAENLYMFGLLPLEDENSSTVRIVLKDGKNDAVVDFLLGTFDMDLGRGAKSAYIRFPQDFQVWQINADFIDVSPKWNDWALNTLWDLKIGRLKEFDGTNDVDLVAGLVKVLINTTLIESTENLSDPQKLFEMKIIDENNNTVYLQFYKDSDKNYVKYEFLPPVNGFYAKMLESATKNKYYLFEARNLELINYVREAAKKQ